ncbi:MAG TPA: hypothetical protein VHD56_14985 [Tepidisphaeraceae bacterium]|nr:hypothetical protein [Tepidisphaeraceae bacterium]
MSMDNEQSELNEQPQGGDSSAGYEAGDESIVMGEEKQPVSRSSLVMFGILVIGAASVYCMYRKAGPSSANAAVAEQSAEADKTINTFLNGGDTSIRSMEQLLKNTEKVVQQFLTYPSITQVPLSDLRTNPFKQHLELPKATENNSETMDKQRREEQRLAITKSAQGLLLQSIMYSETRRACMINSSIYREGQAVDDFTIEKISPAAVVVKNGPYRFELRIQR